MKKGFTLVELLAIIIILSLIAAISIPAVASNLKESRQTIAETSALNYISCVETYLRASILDKNLMKLKEGETYNVSKKTIIDGTEYPAITNLVEFRGEAPKSGTVKVGITKVEVAQLVIDGYRISYSRGSKIVNTEVLE